MTTVANFLIAAACGLVWTNFAAPGILRAFGVPVAFGMWRIERRNQSLNRTQYVWACGVFMWGLGMFLFFETLFYLVKTPLPTFRTLLTWLAAGWLIGVFGARHREHADSSSS